MKCEKPSNQALTIIKKQIRREPRGVLGITTVCKWGYPQVIINRPVSASVADIEIFPTLYWLTCPYLCRKIALLESKGAIAEFEQQIHADQEFADLVAKSHQGYAKERLSLIPVDVRQRMQQEYPDRYQVLAESGVGGARSYHGVKCLHTHLADYLARRDNPIGAEVVRVLDQPLSCADAQCKEFDK